MDKQDASTIARIMVEEIICRHGAPSRIISDCGPAFLGEVLKSIYTLLDIKKSNTTTYHPQTDGLTERFNKTLVQTLSMYVDTHQKDWNEYITFALFAYRSSIQSTTKEKPFVSLYGRQP